MASVELEVDGMTADVEERDGRQVVVLRPASGDNEVVLIPRRKDGWLSVWRLSVAFDELAAGVRAGEIGFKPSPMTAAGAGGFISGAS